MNADTIVRIEALALAYVAATETQFIQSREWLIAYSATASEADKALVGALCNLPNYSREFGKAAARIRYGV